MYLEHFQLKERPFTTSPDPDFLFWGDTHSLAFTMLRYGVMTKAAISVLTGEIGAGKTTLLRELLRELSDDVEIGLLSNIQSGRGELLDWILSALGCATASGEGYVERFRQLQDYLIEAYASGRRVILIFDEAQNMDTGTLEELRMMSNINSEKDAILQIILVGQPQLRELLSKPELKQFSQRVAADFHLDALNKEEIGRYIEHRMNMVGAKWNVFTRPAINLIYKATGGVPRLINILCELCLYAFAADQKVVDEDLLREFLSSARSRGLYEQFQPLGTTSAQISAVL